MESLGAPRLLTLLAQFLYRYLFVISEQAQHMRVAAASRRAAHHRRSRPHRINAASGALAVLFARSYQRAEGIHRAMLARGFSGRFSTLERRPFRIADGLFTAAVAAFLILVRLR
jgi:cobalt/nickel transport system permease protein